MYFEKNGLQTKLTLEASCFLGLFFFVYKHHNLINSMKVGLPPFFSQLFLPGKHGREKCNSASNQLSSFQIKLNDIMKKQCCAVRLLGLRYRVDLICKTMLKPIYLGLEGLVTRLILQSRNHKKNIENLITFQQLLNFNKNISLIVTFIFLSLLTWK